MATRPVTIDDLEPSAEPRTQTGGSLLQSEVGTTPEGTGASQGVTGGSQGGTGASQGETGTNQGESSLGILQTSPSPTPGAETSGF